MSIPFYFRPVELATGAGAESGGNATLVDGGMLSNFPVDIFDRTDGKPPRWPTYGVKLSSRERSRQVARRIDTTPGLAIACLQTLLAAHDAYHLDDEGVTKRTVFVDTMDVSAVDFGIDEATQQTLYDNGRAATAKFLSALD